MRTRFRNRSHLTLWTAIFHGTEESVSWTCEKRWLFSTYSCTCIDLHTSRRQVCPGILDRLWNIHLCKLSSRKSPYRAWCKNGCQSFLERLSWSLPVIGIDIAYGRTAQICEWHEQNEGDQEDISGHLEFCLRVTKPKPFQNHDSSQTLSHKLSLCMASFHERISHGKCKKESSQKSRKRGILMFFSTDLFTNTNVKVMARKFKPPNNIRITWAKSQRIRQIDTILDNLFVIFL